MNIQDQDPFSLAGKTFLVTGASSGIGRECSLRIAAAGGKVVANGRDAGRLGETLQSLAGDGHRSICADLTDKGARASLAEECGMVNGIVHSAGAVRVAPIRYTKEKVLRELMKINAEAPIHLSRELLSRKMVAEGGSLVFISSVSALAGIRGHVAYAASNAALLAAARPLATELAVLKIRCNTLCPGLVETPMVKGGEVSEKDHRRQEKHYPLGFGKPEDVAWATVFFLSPASRWITGQALALDGGLSILG